MTFLFGRRRTAANRRLIDRLNDDIVAAVRTPAFYEAGGIADTFNGRFEVLVLHTALVVRRLQQLDPPAPTVAQDLTDTVFRHLDPALRELGVGDIAVPKRMKRLAEDFLGRSVAYDFALSSGDPNELGAALSRNMYGGSRSAGDLAAYVRAAAASLQSLDLDALLGGRLRFPDPAVFMSEDAA